MSAYIVSPRQVIPLSLTVSQNGGVPGLSPTVELKRASDGFFLDFADNNFKNSGWTTKLATMADMGDGLYQYPVDLEAAGVVVLDVLTAIYRVTDGAQSGMTNDEYNVEDLELMRQAVCNRMEETPGAPGQLTLFDDDGASIRARWEIRDVTGAAVVSTVGTPARRSAKI